METDTLMTEASFLSGLKIQSRKNINTIYRKTGKAKVRDYFREEIQRQSSRREFPRKRRKQRAAVRSQYGREFKPSGILRHHSQRSFFDIAFQYEFIKYSAIVAQRILFYGGKNLPGTVKRKNHHPHQAIFMIFPAIFHHETDYTYTDSHAPIADHVHSVSESA